MSQFTGLQEALTLELSRKAARRWAIPRQWLGGIAVALGDAVSSILALMLACLMVYAAGLATPGGPVWSLPLLGITALATLIPCLCLGLYDTSGRSPVERFRLRVWATLIMPVAAFTLAHLAELGLASMLVWPIATVLSLPLMLLVEAAIRGMLISRSAWGATAVLIGPGPGITTLASFLLAHPDLGFRPVGICCDDLGSPATPPVARLGTLDHSERLAGLADVAIVAVVHGAATVDLASLPFSRIIVVPEIPGAPALWLQPRGFGSSAGFEFNNTIRLMASHRLKRAIDILIAVPLLLFVLPLIAITGLLTKLTSPGPAFYTQSRVGFGGNPVAIYKLRSMYADAEQRLSALLEGDPEARKQWATNVKLTHDPRIIPFVGVWMRRLSIDELPQLWNVVRGEMSLVGPRPFPLYHHDRFGPEFQQLRTSVRPGLTGLWQVSERSNADLRQQEQIDTFYIRNWSLWLDFWIVLRTLPAIVRAQGAR